MLFRILGVLVLAFVPTAAQQVTGQDLDKVLEKADLLLEAAKSAYETARSGNSVAAFVDAGFKLEEARIKYIVLQEIGSPEKQKIAADRIRAANQLSKLIHDGKVAISGSPADSPAPKPETPPDPKLPPPPADKPAPAPAAAPARDVSRRLPVPDAGKQRDSEKVIRDLYKDQYSRKAVADRQILAKTLLEQAQKSTDDAPVTWVLYREAQDISAQSGDLRTALLAVEAAAQTFDIDGLALKGSVLTTAAKAAKLPAEFGSLADSLLKLAEEQLAIDQYDAADKSCAAALTHARKANDPGVVARATNRSKEVAESKARYQAMKSVLEVLAKSPEDPAANLEMGQFLCFVKGSWDLGLRFLLRCSDPVLKGLAEKDLASSIQPADQAAVADAWWDLAQKEKSPLRKNRMAARARALYELALPATTGILQVRLEKRLTEMGPSGLPPVDLLAMIDPKLDSIAGDSTFDGKNLMLVGTYWGRLQIPYSPPVEYDLAMKVERQDGDNTLIIGLVSGESQFAISLDTWAPQKEASGQQYNGLQTLDGKGCWENESMIRGSFLPKGKTVSILLSVRRAGVLVTLDGKKFLDWKGSSKRLGMYGQWAVRNPNALFLGAWTSRFQISQMTLTPFLGQGKSLR
jgi:hypothetical protein